MSGETRTDAASLRTNLTQRKCIDGRILKLLISEMCEAVSVSNVTFYRHLEPDGTPRKRDTATEEVR